jgi:hypothetical protein
MGWTIGTMYRQIFMIELTVFASVIVVVQINVHNKR